MSDFAFFLSFFLQAFCDATFSTTEDPVDPTDAEICIENINKSKYLVTPDHALQFIESVTKKKLLKRIREGRHTRVLRLGQDMESLLSLQESKQHEIKCFFLVSICLC